MASLLVGITVVIAADDGTAVAATALVAVPEDFHQVTRHGALPHVEGAPLGIGEVTLIGRFTVSLALGATIGGKTVASVKFVHQDAQARTIGIGTAPEAHPIVLSNTLGVEFIGNAHAGLHINPRLTLDFELRVPDEQRLNNHRIGGAGAKRRLCLLRVKARALVTGGHLVGIMQSSPCRLGKQLIGLAARIVAASFRERVNGSEHRPLPALVDLIASPCSTRETQHCQ